MTPTDPGHEDGGLDAETVAELQRLGVQSPGLGVRRRRKRVRSGRWSG
jgi:hypothetical protein